MGTLDPMSAEESLAEESQRLFVSFVVQLDIIHMDLHAFSIYTSTIFYSTPFLHLCASPATNASQSSQFSPVRVSAWCLSGGGGLARPSVGD